MAFKSSLRTEPQTGVADLTSEAFSAFMAASGDLLLILDADGVVVAANETARTKLPQPILTGSQPFFAAEHGAAGRGRLAALAAEGSRLTWRMSEEAAAWECTLFPLRVGTDGRAGIGVVGRQASGKGYESAEVEAALKRTALALEAGEIGVWEWDFVTGSFFWDERMRALWALPENVAPTYELFREAMNPADIGRSDAALDAATNPARAGEYEAEYRIIGITDGVERWILAQGRTYFEDGRALRMVGTARDVTERKQRDAHVRFLMREIAHRSKNLLAVIQAMARQTAVTAGSAHDFEQIFSARLQALAASHDILMDEDWHGASIEELARTQVGHYTDLIGTRIDLAGPELMLKPEAAQNLGLALHELSTNAAKYGALSNEHGYIEIRWGMEAGEFKISWQEIGGPQVSKPAREGFGHKVVTRIVSLALEGKVDLRFESAGLIWTLRIPDKHILARGAGGRG